MFDMHRDAAAKRPGVLTKVGLDTFVDPDRQGGAMNARAQAEPFVQKVSFAGEEWLFFPAIAPRVAIMRATTADERGNLSYEHEGAFLGALDQALAARNNGGIVIAQVKRMVRAGSLKPLQVHVPGIAGGLRRGGPGPEADHADRLRPGHQRRDLPPRRQLRAAPTGAWRKSSPAAPRRSSPPARPRCSASASRRTCRASCWRRACTAQVTWVIEQGAVGGVPLLGFAFGCAANADAIVPSPNQFTYFQGGGFDVALLSFLQIDRQGSVNVSKLGAKPYLTAGCGGFVDITTHARKLVFSGFFTAGAKLQAGGRPAHHRAGRQVAQAGGQRRARDLQRAHGARARPAGALCHRALRHRPDAARTDGARDRAGRGPRARRAGPGGFPAARSRRI